MSNDKECIRTAFATVAGIPVVTIPLSHYAELIRCQARTKQNSAKSVIRRHERHSKIDLDPELAVYVRERIKMKAYNQIIAQECIEKFGPSRAPSKSAVHRFRMRERSL